MKIEIEELNIKNIEDFHKQIVDELKSSNSIELDFEDVKKIDLATLQLIVSTKKHCEASKIDYKLINLNTKSVKQTISLLNLKESLGV